MTSERRNTVIASLAAPIQLAKTLSNSKNQQFRNKYMRDRDRILYSKAFRRLAGKTQVYLANLDDHKRTRLTHTLEVAQIAKTISAALKLNIDLTEAIALGHDIGHTPFGHAGEEILHQLMTPRLDKYYIEDSPMSNIEMKNFLKPFSGFKHNLQSARVAITLENMYHNSGLDLTNFTLYGLMNHSSLEYRESRQNNNWLGFYNYLNNEILLENKMKAWSFESYVVAQADEIAQRHHDLEDAIRGNLITIDDVLRLTDASFRGLFTPVDKMNFNAVRKEKGEGNTNYFMALLSRMIVNLFVIRLIKNSIINLNKLIEEHKIKKDNFNKHYFDISEEDSKKIISYDLLGDSTFQGKFETFSDEISTRTLSSYDIQRMDAKGQYVLRKLFEAFYNNPTQLPDNSINAFFNISKQLGNENIVQQIKKSKGIGYLRHEFSKLFTIHPFEKDDAIILMRVICDHLSGMTDAYAIETYDKLYGRLI